MDNYQLIVSAVGTLGFPIVMCLLMFFKLQKVMDSVVTAVSNNTLAIQRLIDKQELPK